MKEEKEILTAETLEFGKWYLLDEATNCQYIHPAEPPRVTIDINGCWFDVDISRLSLIQNSQNQKLNKGMNKDQYYEDLQRRQTEHLDRVRGSNFNTVIWRPCMHDQCGECIGTGVKHDGSPCVHMISCPCPRCSPSFM